MAPAEMRLFVALELPAEVRGALVAWRARLIDDARLGLRAVGADSLHATLCFLGSRPAGVVEDVVRACECVRGRLVRELSVGEMLWLPARRPRVVAVALVDRLGELATLQGELRGALAAAGLIAPERRRFVAHVTLARVRPGGVARRPRLPPLVYPPFDARRVILYRSHLGGGPARYEPLHQVELARR